MAVTAYGVVDDITFPLLFEVYKPKERLKAGEEYRTKPKIAAGMIRTLQQRGSQIERVLADSLYGESGVPFVKRWIREIIYGKRRTTQFWQLSTDPETLPANGTWYVMSHIEKVKYDEIGNLYRLRNWVEYRLRQSKNELGWADFRVTRRRGDAMTK